MKWQMITFNTPSYESVVNKLIDSCHEHNIDIIAFKELDQGSWERNCGLKPKVILEAMILLKRPIVFVDADAIVREYPALFDHITEDFAAHFREWNRGKELLSGTLFFNNTERAHLLAEQWYKQQDKQPNEWDQKTLDHVLKIVKCSKYNLPPNYTQIFDSMAKHGKPVIEHFQHSRTLRKKL